MLCFTIFLNLTDSNGPVLSTIELNTELCVCSKLYGVSYSITLPDDKTCKLHTNTCSLYLQLTSILSESIIVSSRWAIVRIVQ